MKFKKWFVSIIVAVMCLVLSFAMVGCGNDDKTPGDNGGINAGDGNSGGDTGNTGGDDTGNTGGDTGNTGGDHTHTYGDWSIYMPSVFGMGSAIKTCGSDSSHTVVVPLPALTADHTGYDYTYDQDTHVTTYTIEHDEGDITFTNTEYFVTVADGYTFASLSAEAVTCFLTDGEADTWYRVSAMVNSEVSNSVLVSAGVGNTNNPVEIEYDVLQAFTVGAKTEAVENVTLTIEETTASDPADAYTRRLNTQIMNLATKADPEDYENGAEKFFVEISEAGDYKFISLFESYNIIIGNEFTEDGELTAIYPDNNEIYSLTQGKYYVQVWANGAFALVSSTAVVVKPNESTTVENVTAAYTSLYVLGEETKIYQLTATVAGEMIDEVVISTYQDKKNPFIIKGYQARSHGNNIRIESLAESSVDVVITMEELTAYDPASEYTNVLTVDVPVEVNGGNFNAVKYKVEIAEAGSYQFVSDKIDTRFDIYIGNEFTDGELEPLGSFTDTYDLEVGTYYIEVYGSGTLTLSKK